MSTSSTSKLSNAPGHFPHNSPLFLFEETFGPLISQSKSITIKYSFLDLAPDLDDGDTISVISVNGCSSSEEFTQKLTDLVTAAIANFEDFLDSMAPAHAELHLDQALLKLATLGNNITTDQLRVQNIPGAEPVYRTFKCFSNFRLDGPFRGNCQLFAQAISFKAEAYAEAWLNVIAAACDHLQLIRKFFKNLLADENSRANQSGKVLQGYNLKFNLSVPQIGYLFRMFDHTDVIEVPNRGNPELIEWITSNFQSKGRNSIQPKSLRNKLFTPDLAALDFWEDKLEQMQEHIRAERDRLLR